MSTALTAVLAWAVFPLVLGTLCLGAGLLVARLTPSPLPRTLLLPVGLAVVVVLGQATTALPVTASWSVPALVVAGLAGYLLAADKLGPWGRAMLAPAAAAAATYAVYLLPVVATGTPTFAGWIKLDDGATWLAFADRLVTAGRSVEGLAPSSYEAVLQLNLDSAYPVGAFVPLGEMARLLRVDAAWLLQPYLAFLAAVLAVAAYWLLIPHVALRWVRALAGVVSASAALLFGYALWGGVKELALAPLIAAAVGLATRGIGPEARPRDAVPLGVVSAAILSVAGPSGGFWLVVPLVVGLALLVRRTDRRTALRSTWWYVGLLLVLSAPLLVLSRPGQLGSLAEFAAGSDDIGNLWGPLSLLQALGIWPVGDFRATPEPMGPVLVILGISAALAVAGVVKSARIRDFSVAVYAMSALLVAVTFSFGNAWIGGKAIAVASPTLLVAAFAGIGWLLETRRLVEAGVATIVVAGGVAWSAALAYDEVWLAPYDQLAELSAIGESTAENSPGLMTEYNPYGVRHFLRAMDAEGANELRRRSILLTDGSTADKAAYVDIDEIRIDQVEQYDTLVLRRSGTASRPPSNYRLVSVGEYYEEWRKDPAASAVEQRVSLGTQLDPVGVPDCGIVRQLAGLAGPDGRLATVFRDPAVNVSLSDGLLPEGWYAAPEWPGAVTPTGPGTLTREFSVPTSGTYGLWLLGSFRGALDVTVDGSPVYSGAHRINWPGNATPLGYVSLEPGTHSVTLTYSESPLAPGSGGSTFPLGPLVLSTSTGATGVTYVAPADAPGALCGRTLDWIEVVRP